MATQTAERLRGHRTQSTRRVLASVFLALLCGANGCTRRGGEKPLDPEVAAPGSSTSTPSGVGAAPAEEAEERSSTSSERRFLIVGGGPFPESNEVSMEQDVALMKRTLPGPGVVLFAAGAKAKTVRELATEDGADPVKRLLGDFFAPRPGRTSRYREPRFDAEPATFPRVERTLSRLLEQGQTPLLLYIAGHGEKGEAPSENSVALWGGQRLRVNQLADWHERHARPLRVIATTCFSGGFGELAFAQADAASGRVSPVPRCGVFAGTFDRETSGCDPNPSRKAQESYALHLTHALSGLAKDGSRLARDRLDLDGDGEVGLLEAHTWARIRAESLDVPTTTSERWLRAVEPGSAPLRPELLPEDAAVLAQLGEALGLETEAAAS